MPEPRAAHYIPPLEFARDVLHAKLWSKQEEVLAALPDQRRVAVKSGNGLGKGFSAAVVTQWLHPSQSPKPSPACIPPVLPSHGPQATL